MIFDWILIPSLLNTQHLGAARQSMEFTHRVAERSGISTTTALPPRAAPWGRHIAKFEGGPNHSSSCMVFAFSLGFNFDALLDLARFEDVMMDVSAWRFKALSSTGNLKPDICIAEIWDLLTTDTDKRRPSLQDAQEETEEVLFDIVGKLLERTNTDPTEVGPRLTSTKR